MENKTVVIVDDKASYRRTLKNILTMIGGVEIIGEATNGEDYLELIRKITPDITFMDIEMPIMDGIEATKRALAIKKDLVIIGISIFSNDAYIDKMMEAGARGYLLKLSNNFSLFKNIINHPTTDIFFSEQVENREKVNRGEDKSIKTILIVDDFATNTIVIESALVGAGFAVLKALNADDALKYIYNDEYRIDLLVSDYNMPNKNGAELIMEFKKVSKYKNTPAIILSSDENEEKRKLAKTAGATGWMKKPFILSTFIKVIDSCI